ncbi:(Fe-S)-binding protein [Streptomyces sp. NPDC006552]|uniref:(Fe-S)-binding protein n=1 Tax=Streptomyces sp. NPDC006552 TaxID=3157179 RepID=UPI0033AC25D1
MRVALFLTCVNDTLYPDTGRAVVKLLTRLGVEVDFPAAQTCCGQAHYNTGYRHQAEPLARHFSDVFGSGLASGAYDAVVTPSGSCAAMVRELYPRMGERARAEGRGSALATTLAPVVPKTYELTEFLVDVLKVTDVGAYYPHTVTYHPTCHGLRSLGLGDRPTQLLRSVRGLELVELPGAEECCGFGGTFAVKNPDVSAAMGADKIRNAEATGADVLCAADNSCLMHLGGTMSRLRTELRPVHIAEILASTEGDLLT